MCLLCMDCWWLSLHTGVFFMVKNEVSVRKGALAIAADMVCHGHAELGCNPRAAYQILSENRLRR